MNKHSTKIKRKICLTKVLLYMILVVAAVVFGVLSFSLYMGDLQSELVPQVNRAVTQISQVLPQLEEMNRP